MAVISEVEEEVLEQQNPSSSSPPPAPQADPDEEALASVLAKKGPMPFLEAAIDLVRRQSDFFTDEAAVTKVVRAVTAAKEKVDAEERLKKRAADDAAKAEKRLKEAAQEAAEKTEAKDQKTEAAAVPKDEEKEGLRSKLSSSF
ncbi:hypothetical protein BHM03_00008205 [Ensete ventricosum]|nr:hypothetical protein BHM03_00008205 [Ensete ventricosum]